MVVPTGKHGPMQRGPRCPGGVNPMPNRRRASLRARNSSAVAPGVPGLGKVVACGSRVMQISLNVKRDCAVRARSESNHGKSQGKNAGQSHPVKLLKNGLRAMRPPKEVALLT